MVATPSTLRRLTGRTTSIIGGEEKVSNFRRNTMRFNAGAEIGL
jgi:hypothetical protein